MNEVFIMEKVITEVKFDFILNSKHISIARFRTVTVCDEQEIEIMAYDEMADYVYATIKQNTSKEDQFFSKYVQKRTFR